MTPSLEIGNGNWAVQSDSLLGYKTINGKYYPREMSVTRATTGTRVNAAGLVELVPYNLLSDTNDLNGWGLLNASRITNQNNPFGSNDAIKLTYNTTNGAHYIFRSSPSIGQVTISIYAKAGELNFLQIASAQILGEYANFNLSTGVVGTKGTSCSSSLIENVGDGWYRCTATLTNGTNTVYFCIANSASMEWFGTNTYAGANTTDGLFLYGAQLVEGSEPLTYIPTTTRLNIARIDYSTGSPALLVEPFRTNLALRSEEFDNTTIWASGAGGTAINPVRTANSTISPSGIQNADTIIFDRGAGNTLTDQSVITQPLTIATTGTYFFSIWLKATASGDIGKQIFIRCGSAGNLQAVTLTSNWVRYETTATVTSGVDVVQLGNRGTITNANSVSVDLWGAQLELGSYSTSYIPTTSASVTRNGDGIIKSGISALIGQTEGTIYLEADIQKHNETEFYITISNGYSLSEAIYLYQPSGGILQVLFRTGGVNETISILNANWNIGYNKIAIAYNSTSGEVFMNGVSQGTVALTALPTCSQLTLGSRPDIPSYNVGSGGYKVASLWKTRLTNTQLAQITTL
jgi:hypothetical protein